MRTIRKNILLLVVVVAGTDAGATRATATEAGAAGAAGTESGATEPVDYGELAAILGYVATDYATAVGPNGVLDPQEYSEQKGFLAEAVRQSMSLPVGEADIRSLLEEAKLEAGRGVPPSQLVPKVTEALGLLEQRHDLGQVPKQVPSAARGRELYMEGCQACHAADGSGRTGLKLSTQPPDFRDRTQSGAFSPARIFRAASYGVPGTAMPSFNLAYATPDRWSVAFYMLSLAHGSGNATPDAGALAPTASNDLARLAGFTLTDLARQSDDDLRAALAAKAPQASDRERALDWLRGVAPYQQSVAGEGKVLAGARQAVAEAQRLYRAGNVAAARHAAISAYLDDFEPFEAPLRARDPGLVNALEGTFMRLRAGIEAAAPPLQIDALAAELQRGLLKAEDAVSTGSPWVAFMASLAIALREGLEAALFLSVMLALAFKSGRPRATLAVHLGWVSALLLGAATWFLSGAIVARSGQSRELTEGITVLLTAVLLLGASHWVLAQASAKKLGHFLSHRVALMKGAGWGLGGLAFLAIYREAFEVVVFYRGLLLQASGQSRAVSLGAVAGLISLVGVVAVFQRLVGHKLRPRPLLVTCGVVLCGLAVTMVGEGIRSLQEAGVLGQHLVTFPEIPQLGVFATAQGLWAQGVVLLGLLASVAYSLRRTRIAAAPAGLTPMPPSSGQNTAS